MSQRRMEGAWSVAKHSDTSKRCPKLRRKLAGALDLWITAEPKVLGVQG